MNPNMAAFVKYDPDGKPFMGLFYTDGGIEVNLYLGHKQNSGSIIAGLIEQLQHMRKELIQTPDKLVGIEGGDVNAFVRPISREQSKRSGVVRHKDTRRP